jgi:hypothetical protein
MLGWIMNDTSEKMWKESVLAFSFRNWVKLSQLSARIVRIPAEIQTGHFSDMLAPEPTVLMCLYTQRHDDVLISLSFFPYGGETGGQQTRIDIKMIWHIFDTQKTTNASADMH